MRTAKIKRKTNETSITEELNIDGTGTADISTGIGFFDHMLKTFVRYGTFDLSLTCKGDLYVDKHHTIEDIGMMIGKSFKTAIGDKKGINRFGEMILPMDETLCLCAIDFSGRPCFVMDYEFKREKINDFPTECVHDFFYSFAVNAGLNLHFIIFKGRNEHHIIEAMFKSFGIALNKSCACSGKDVLSTKGKLDN